MLTRDIAEQLVGQWIASEVDLRDAPALADVADAFIYLKYPVPLTLGDAIAAELQRQAPPGYVVSVTPYLGSLRTLVVKEHVARRFLSRPAGEYD